MIDIIVVNWNSRDQLAYCVSSLNSEKIGKIVVVDNASFDNSADFLDFENRVTLVRSQKNIGFGAGCNLGARYAESKYLLFLNPDAAILPGSLDLAFNYMEDPSNGKAGICGVQLIDGLGDVSRTCSRFPSSGAVLAHATGLSKLFPKLGQPMAEWAHDQSREVDQVMGAFFLVRRCLFESLKGFDERFFVYYEEVDFSYRARMAGWHSIYLAEAQAYHAGGGTSDQIKARRLFYSLRSRLLYADKHFRRLDLAVVVMATLLIEPLSRSILALFARSWSSLIETWLGYAMLWRWVFNRNAKVRP